MTYNPKSSVGVSFDITNDKKFVLKLTSEGKSFLVNTFIFQYFKLTEISLNRFPVYPYSGPLLFTVADYLKVACGILKINCH